MVSIFVEGAGHTNELSRSCRRGFAQFFKNAGLSGAMPKVVACGSRENTYSRFRAELTTNSTAMLLVDAEAPVTAPGPWQHLKDIDGWDRPVGATDNHCHLMVQAMESWFLADRAGLASFYGQGFRVQDLPQNSNIEAVSKPDTLNGLAQATRGTRKGSYKKGVDSFQILEKLDPIKVRAASAYADRFMQSLSSHVP